MLVDYNMLNLRSDKASLSSSNNRNEIGTVYPQESFASPSNQAPQVQPVAKRKRNHAGNPDPESEVVAMSPNSLLATNRFICDVCNKGFQRDQNLQLHRRGHNLPWKLKQRTSEEVVKKKVYICPEPTCIHHEPSRALGDLTGIKKHYSRKHGRDKKWKCEKCSKRYAVRSDWKAHFKICGTREYRCDCGILFSRRDSFITHRAFCDALTDETTRPIMETTHVNNIQTQHHNHGDQQELQENPNPNLNHIFSSSSTPHFAHMSATALLQKASQMGVTNTMSKPPDTIHGRPHQLQTHMSRNHDHFVSTSTAGSCLGLSSREEITNGLIHNYNSLASFENKAAAEHIGSSVDGGGVPSSLQHTSRFQESCFDQERFNGTLLNSKGGQRNYHETFTQSAGSHLSGGFGGCGGGGGSSQDRLTRDFLGVRAMSQVEFINMSGVDHINSFSSHNQPNQNPPPWQ